MNNEIVASVDATFNNNLSLDADMGVVYDTKDGKVLYGTSEYWNNQTELVSHKGYVYLYSDYKTDAQGNDIAGIKVGDGVTLLIDLPFTNACQIDDENVSSDTTYSSSKIVNDTAYSDVAIQWYGGSSATVTGVSSFEDFYDIVHNKKYRVVLKQYQSEDSGKVKATTYAYCFWDYYDDRSTITKRLRFIGCLCQDGYTYPTLLEITFSNSLNGTVKRLQSADNISYSGNVSSNTVKGAIDKLSTNKQDAFVELTGTLTAGETTITFTNQAITANSTIDPYVDEAFLGVVPTSQVTDGINHTVTLTFPVQSANIPVKVRIS